MYLHLKAAACGRGLNLDFHLWVTTGLRRRSSSLDQFADVEELMFFLRTEPPLSPLETLQMVLDLDLHLSLFVSSSLLLCECCVCCVSALLGL